MGKTYGEEFDEAMRCNTKEEADAWLAQEIARRKLEFGQSPEKAEHIIKVNLGYMAGYRNHATAQKILNLFGAPHPIFRTTY